MTDLVKMGKSAKLASRELAKLTTDQKNAALMAIADELEAQAAAVLAQNALDIEDGKANGLTSGLLDRLLLTEERVSKLADDCRAVAKLPDPVGSA
ncbi:MAG: gamma-glutamyl-phosphate reductase, partial [Chloroflexota bacterium]